MKVVIISRSRGRPKLGDVRIETVVPKAVLIELVRVERQSNGQVYRTRVAANVLCEWAKEQAVSRSVDSSHQTASC